MTRSVSSQKNGSSTAPSSSTASSRVFAGALPSAEASRRASPRPSWVGAVVSRCVAAEGDSVYEFDTVRCQGFCGVVEGTVCGRLQLAAGVCLVTVANGVVVLVIGRLVRKCRLLHSSRATPPEGRQL